MHVLRPIRESDLPQLIELAGAVEGGLTTLPPQEPFLRERIDESLRAFHPRVRKPGGEYYLFVLEDRSTGAIVGTSGIAARVGGFEPFYSYELRIERFAHPALGIDKPVSVLHLKETHDGPSEIGSLFLRADHRRAGLGRLLSLGRFLFLATFPQRFGHSVIAELRGYLDQHGRSPFWEAVGRHFFEHDFYTADLLSGLGDKQFIADLMPRHPLYVALLPESVQAVIGRVHHQTEPALRLLTTEGFRSTAEIDIFDAGPQLEARVAELRTVKHARVAKIHSVVDVPQIAPSDDHAETGSAEFLISNRRLDFRATIGPVISRPDDSVDLERETAAALDVKAGDEIVFSAVRPARDSPRDNPTAVPLHRRAPA